MAFDSKCKFGGLLATAALAIGAGRAYAISTATVSVIPGHALAAVIVEPSENTNDRRSTLQLAATLVDHARRMGLLSNFDTTAAMWLDVLVATPVLLEQPLCLVLTHIEAETDESGSHHLGGMRLGLILHTRGQNTRIEAALQRFLNTYTNTDVTQIERIGTEDLAFYRLKDSRLPDWAIIEWGQVGEHYVIAVGTGAFAELADTIRGESRSLADDEWFTSARNAIGADPAPTCWYVNLKPLETSLAAIMKDIPHRVLTELKLSNVERGLWWIGEHGRANTFTSFQRIEGRDQLIQIAAPATDLDLAGSLIPTDATRYTLFHWEPTDFLTRMCDAYLACRSPKARRSSREYWREIEAELEISFQRDIFHQLGPRVLIHNDPPHPFDIGLLRTVQIEIAGSPRLIRESLDKLLRHWQGRRPVKISTPSRDEWPSTLSVTVNARTSFLHHATDGLWYVQFGIYGPAIAVGERWVVISFSPQAVRQNMARLRTGEAPAPTGTTPP